MITRFFFFGSFVVIMLRAWLALLVTTLLLSGCTSNTYDHRGFSLVESSHSGITFTNFLKYNESFNAYTYRNFYNGAGVALGDINNDGLLDIYFSGNQVDNRLYLNEGNFRFKDITVSAGVSCSNVWSTGVSMADVNGDGWLDIFVCKSGPPFGGVRHNELFINNGDLTFTEASKEWGVADEGLSIHAVFFDYDKDGDLDFYLLNNSNRSVGIYDLKIGQREVRDPFGGNKLYRNDGGHFIDVSEQSGIYSSAIGFGLGVTIADINRDGWQDIYVSNDFFERDYIYLNNGDGTFTEALEELVTEISMGSMGADIADINNDGYPEIFVTEMLPESLERIRTKTLFESWDKYRSNVENGYFRQFTRNVLQLNNKRISSANHSVSFSEIGRYSNVYATDWSWGALIFDYNNDGYKDIFVANGIAKDLTDQDYIHFEAGKLLNAVNLRSDSALLKTLIDRIPSEPVPNYLFENQTDLKFINKSPDVGLDFSGFSNGAAYGDLDNDGFLDLVVNNINAEALIYKNLGIVNSNSNFIQIQLLGVGNNKAAFGTQVSVYCQYDSFYIEQSPVRGYLSSVDPKLHIGIGHHEVIDSIIIRWNDNLYSVLRDIRTNQLLSINESKILKIKNVHRPKDVEPFFKKEISVVSYKHEATSFIDFDRDRLLFEAVTNEGPGMAIADVNHDGLDDLFICGGADQASALWIQVTPGSFKKSNEGVFQVDKKSEDVKAIFFDANNDGHIDLYVASGGNQFPFGSPMYKDRLYFNNGFGIFAKANGIVDPIDMTESTGFVVNIDFDEDGDEDIIVGSRLIPFYYGYPAQAFLLMNDGNGRFKDVTLQYAPEFLKLGLLRDAVCFDFDRDGDLDLLLCGEWMQLRLFENREGFFYDISEAVGLNDTQGFWSTLAIGDFNQDGFIDFVAGNMGLNSRIGGTKGYPVSMYVNDFDRNGSPEQILCVEIDKQEYPLVLLHDLWRQIPSLKKKFPNFSSYRSATITNLFNPEIVEESIKLKANVLQSSVFLNNKGRSFTPIALPSHAQFSKLYALQALDVNNDSILDIVYGGNQFKAKPEYGIQGGTYGGVLIGKGDGTFSIPAIENSGIFIKGEIRDIDLISLGNENHIVFSRSNDSLVFFSFNKFYEKN